MTKGDETQFRNLLAKARAETLTRSEQVRLKNLSARKAQAGRSALKHALTANE
jgi:hypothetical protein